MVHAPYCLYAQTIHQVLSQMYHQVYAIRNNPFNKYKSFYKFAKQYVQVKQKKIGAMTINDWSHGLQSILDDMKPYTIAYTQKEAGFKVTTGVGDMPTAFMASYGSGKPIIGILAEYDALPGLAQEGGNSEKAIIAGKNACLTTSK